jgi:transcriptional regulator with XRE-family HTH domain
MGDDFARSVGQRIRALRELNGLTQAEFGARIESPAITVRQWETGKRQPRLQMICKVANAFHVPLSTLLPASQRKGGA